MTQATNLLQNLNSSSTEEISTEKLMRFCQLIIQLDNERIKAEREAEEQKK